MEKHEYKILASNTPAFAKREKLQRILEEEAQAGWQLLEKLDNYKIRLVRDTSARAGDAERAIDPYRSQVGVHSGVVLGVAAAATLVVIYLVVQLAAMSL